MKDIMERIIADKRMEVLTAKRLLPLSRLSLLVEQQMEQERDDLDRYINLFGYNPKYGVEGKPIGSVTYKAQPYNPRKPLYEV